MELANNIVPIIITALLTGGLPWIFLYRYKRRQEKAQAVGSELDNAQKVVDLFKDLSEGQNKEIDLLRNELGIVKAELAVIKQNACYNSECTNRKRSKS